MIIMDILVISMFVINIVMSIFEEQPSKSRCIIGWIVGLIFFIIAMGAK
jgi:hypothetical protein